MESGIQMPLEFRPKTKRIFTCKGVYKLINIQIWQQIKDILHERRKFSE